MHVEIRDPEDKIILSQVYSSEGKFTFTSHMPGEHVICLYSNSTKWFSGSQLRVHLDIQVIEGLHGGIFMHLFCAKMQIADLEKSYCELILYFARLESTL